MNKKELHNLIDSFATDIEFSYKGTKGLIMPLHRDINITLCYGDDDVILKTADEVMQYPMFNGQSLNDVCELVLFA